MFRQFMRDSEDEDLHADEGAVKKSPKRSGAKRKRGDSDEVPQQASPKVSPDAGDEWVDFIWTDL